MVIAPTPDGQSLRIAPLSKLSPELLEAVKASKPEILIELSKRAVSVASTEPLPEPLKRLLAAASNGVLPDGGAHLETGYVQSFSGYVTAWGLAWHGGDREHVLTHLWAAHRVWASSVALVLQA